MTTRDRNLRELPGLRLFVEDRARRQIAVNDRNLQNLAGDGSDRQEGAVGRAPFWPERGQNHVANRIIVLEHLEQRLVEASARVALGSGEELVLEAERIEEGSEPRIVVMAEALMVAERIGDLC